MPRNPLPSVPWQSTGNHWVALPCIHPADGSIHAAGVVHRGARSAIEFAGGAAFLDGGTPPLARPVIALDGRAQDLAAGAMAWERALGWLPTFTCTLGDVVVRGTIFAPYGRDADLAGAVYTLTFENRGRADVALEVSLEGTLGWRQQRVRTPRGFDDPHRAAVAADGIVVLEGAARPGLVALAVATDGDADASVAEGATPGYRLARSASLAAGGRVELAFFLAAGPERDGAVATASFMRRRGWRALLTATREAIQALEQSTGSEAVDRFVNRNLLFAYFFGVARALDDAHYYLVRTRAPGHSLGVTLRDWEALTWTIPAVQLADPSLARELLLRMCELHGYAPGRGTHYLDGTLFEPGFSLEGVAAYALAVDRYIRDTGDDELVEDPVVADTLYLVSDDIADRRDKQMPLYSTEVGPAGDPAPFPYTLHGNAVVAQALEVLRRTLDEETSRGVDDPEGVRAAMRRAFPLNRESDRQTFASAIDLAGHSTTDDDPVGSIFWLPMYDAVDRQDSTYRRTAKAQGSAGPSLARHCARLLGPDGAQVLQWLRRAALDQGVAAAEVDDDGRATADGGDASLAGLLAYTTWYVVHALGVRP